MIKQRVPGKTIKADMKQLSVTVDGGTVFKQTPGELGGMLCGRMSFLRLPSGTVGPQQSATISHELPIPPATTPW